MTVPGVRRAYGYIRVMSPVKASTCMIRDDTIHRNDLAGGAVRCDLAFERSPPKRFMGPEASLISHIKVLPRSSALGKEKKQPLGG